MRVSASGGTWREIDGTLPGHQRIGNQPEAKGDDQPRTLKVVILGGDGSTYGSLSKGLRARGHQVLLLRGRFTQLKERFAGAVRDADLVVVTSHVHEGVAAGEWVTRIAQGVTAFYDFDTPVTLAKLVQGNLDYVTADLIPKYQMYLSFTGGPALRLLEEKYGSPMARPLFCSVDATLYYPEKRQLKWDLGYITPYREDCQPALDELLVEPARKWPKGRFAVAGAHYPRSLQWPRNVKRFTRLSAAKRRAFYNSQRFALNIACADMIDGGSAPSMELLEAAACGIPIISDRCEGLETLLSPFSEILVSDCADTTLQYLKEISEEESQRIGAAARRKVLEEHTAKHRAMELEGYVLDVREPVVVSVKRERTDRIELTDQV